MTSYFNKLISNIRDDLSQENLMRNIINPLTPYFLCDHFFGHEGKRNWKFDYFNDKNDLIMNLNFSKIKNYDIVQCDVNYLNKFVDYILPKLKTKIILFTSQATFPAVKKGISVDKILASENVLLWVSQNPLFLDNEKIMGFPYGIFINHLLQYTEVLLEEDNIDKTVNINLLNINKNTNPTREIFPDKPKLNIKDYYREIKKSKYVLSPIGDRDDCFRHYECIGLETYPISNVSEPFKSIFGSNMIYMSAEEMLKAYNKNKIDHEYTIPNKDLISSEYYKDLLYERINNIKSTTNYKEINDESINDIIIPDIDFKIYNPNFRSRSIALIKAFRR